MLGVERLSNYQLLQQVAVPYSSFFSEAVKRGLVTEYDQEGQKPRSW
jgi:hypothetical protein